MGIDWGQVFTAALIGAAISLVVELTRRLASKIGWAKAGATVLGSTAAVALAVSYSPLGSRIAESIAARQQRAKVDRVLSEKLAPMLESSELRARLEGMDSQAAFAVTAELTAEGMLRLPDARLVRRVELLREAIDGSDAALCAAHFTGTSPEGNMQLMANLSDASMEEWATLARDAALAALSQEHDRVVPTDPEAQRAFEAVGALLSEPDGQRLSKALSQPNEIDSETACWSVKTLYGTVLRLEGQERTIAARVLAIQ